MNYNLRCNGYGVGFHVGTLIYSYRCWNIKFLKNNGGHITRAKPGDLERKTIRLSTVPIYNIYTTSQFESLRSIQKTNKQNIIEGSVTKSPFQIFRSVVQILTL